MANASLSKAKAVKNDEFYTQLRDIELELKHYKTQFEGKVVFCNCDDPEWSNFWLFFKLYFDEYKLKKVISTHYDKENPSYKLEYDGVNIIKTKLIQNGDFRSDECIEILKSADIVITNPPFSLFREYIAQLIEYKKQFLIIGNKNAITNKDIFPLIKENRLWIGMNNVKDFKKPSGEIQSFGNIGWYTNLPNKRRNEELILYKEYNKKEYPKYDNYDAINVNKITDIPKDYKGIMGVPITFLDKYNPKQFDIIWQASGNTRACAPENILKELNYVKNAEDRGGCGVINDKRVFSRIFIKRKEFKNED